MTPAFEMTRCAGCGREVTIARIGEAAPALCTTCGELDGQARQKLEAQLEKPSLAPRQGS